MRVIDVASGKARVKAGVKATGDTQIAFGDKLYLVANDNGYQVREYDLAKLGEPRVVLTNTDDSRKITAAPARCAREPHLHARVHRLRRKSIHVVAVDTKEGKPYGASRRPMPVALSSWATAWWRRRAARRWVRWCSTVTESRCSARTPRRPIRCGSTHRASCCSRRDPRTERGRGPDRRGPGWQADAARLPRRHLRRELLLERGVPHCPAEDGFRAWRFTG